MEIHINNIKDIEKNAKINQFSDQVLDSFREVYNKLPTIRRKRRNTRKYTRKHKIRKMFAIM